MAPPLPAEHGAWAVLALPIVLGLAGGGFRSPASWAVAGAVVFVFLAQAALVPVGRRRWERRLAASGWAARRIVWGSVHLAAAILLFALAWAATPSSSRPALAAVAGVAAASGSAYAVASVLGASRILGVELVGMAGSSLNAAMIALAGGAPVDRGLAAAPALAFAYCVSTVSWVRAWRRLGEARRRATVACVVAHLVLVAALAFLAAANWLSPWTVVAALPLLARTVWGLASPPEDLRRVGLREVGLVLAYAAVAIVVLSAT